MKKILDPEKLSKIVKDLHSQNKSIVLAGGVFDILHDGHIKFLKEAKKAGDFLFVFLESDENVKNKKGENRPVNSQKHRSIVLETLDSIDYIIPLIGVTKNEEYDKLIVQIKPALIALTWGDANVETREKQAKMSGAKLVLIKKVESPSTSDLINKI